jgi:membrane associated rhomboid family serine protease
MARFGSHEDAPISSEPSQSGTTAPQQGGAFAAPLIVLAVAAVLVAMHAFLMLLPKVSAMMIEWRLALSPLMVRQGLQNGRMDALLPLASHILLHANLVHLLFNVAWLLPLGSGVARRFGAADFQWGGPRAALAFLALFVSSGVVGGVAFVLFNSNSIAPAVGASGAIFGLLGGVMRFWTGREIPRGASSAAIVPLGNPFVIRMTIANVGLNLLLGLAPQLFGLPSIAWEAHLGGYFFGLLAFPLFARAAAR